MFSSVVSCEVVEDPQLCGIVVSMRCLNMFSSVVSCEVVEDTPLCGIATLFSLHKSLDKCDFAPSDTTLQLGNKPAEKTLRHKSRKSRQQCKICPTNVAFCLKRCDSMFLGGTIAFNGFGFRKPLLMIWFKLLIEFESGLFFFWPCFNKKRLESEELSFRFWLRTQIAKLTPTWGPVKVVNHKKIDTWCTQYYLLVVKVSHTVPVCRNKKEGLSAWYRLDLW